jgi:uncharacterized OB-fold protein
MLLPALDANNEAFWTGGRDGELRIARCASCRTWIHPPVPYCASCGSRSVAPEAASGRGHVHAFTRTESAVIALVELDEQPALRLLTNIIECAPDDITVGMTVDVTFQEAEDVFLPVFRPRA